MEKKLSEWSSEYYIVKSQTLFDIISYFNYNSSLFVLEYTIFYLLEKQIGTKSQLAIMINWKL
jgi:hypothetical protein